MGFLIVVAVVVVSLELPIQNGKDSLKYVFSKIYQAHMDPPSGLLVLYILESFRNHQARLCHVREAFPVIHEDKS